MSEALAPEVEDVSPAPEPGAYDHVPEDEYHAWSGCFSKSRLWPMVTGFATGGLLELCPAKLKHHLEHGFPHSDAFTVGSALDCLLLEPREFDHRFIMARSCGAIMKSGDRKDEPCGAPGKGLVDGEWRCGKHGGKADSIPAEQTLLDHIEMSKVRAMGRSARSHDILGRYLSEPHEPQVAVVGEIFGHTFKGRFDLLRRDDGDGLVVDLKKSRSPQPHLFQRQAWQLGYHVQAFIYMTLAHQHDLIGDEARFHFAVVGDSSLYGSGRDAVHPVYIYEASDEFLAAGRQHCEQLVQTFNWCVANHEWPTPDAITHELDPPRWADITEGSDDDE